MPIATLTGKGQITIPASVRQSLGLRAGDKLEFVINENGEVLCKPVVRQVDDVFGKLHKPGKKTVSVAAMDAAIRRKLQDRDK